MDSSWNCVSTGSYKVVVLSFRWHSLSLITWPDSWILCILSIGWASSLWCFWIMQVPMLGVVPAFLLPTLTMKLLTTLNACVSTQWALMLCFCHVSTFFEGGGGGVKTSFPPFPNPSHPSFTPPYPLFSPRYPLILPFPLSLLPLPPPSWEEDYPGQGLALTLSEMWQLWQTSYSRTALCSKLLLSSGGCGNFEGGEGLRLL